MSMRLGEGQYGVAVHETTGEVAEVNDTGVRVDEAASLWEVAFVVDESAGPMVEALLADEELPAAEASWLVKEVQSHEVAADNSNDVPIDLVEAAPNVRVAVEVEKCSNGH